MPRGASRFDTAEPGSPSTWEYIVRAEKAASSSSPTGLDAMLASSPPSSPAAGGSPSPGRSVDIAKLDELMRQAHKARGVVMARARACV